VKRATKTKSPAARRPASDPVLRRAPQVIARKNADGTVGVMRLEDESHYFVLDKIAAEFWEMINGKRTLGAIRDALAKRHRPPPRFERDVDQLVQQLKKNRLLAP
jgi:hypothetical protein